MICFACGRNRGPALDDQSRLKSERTHGKFRTHGVGAGSQRKDTVLESTPASTRSVYVSHELRSKLSNITEAASGDLWSLAKEIREMIAELESGQLDPKAI
jgi:hypothetical protein